MSRQNLSLIVFRGFFLFESNGSKNSSPPSCAPYYVIFRFFLTTFWSVQNTRRFTATSRTIFSERLPSSTSLAYPCLALAGSHSSWYTHSQRHQVGGTILTTKKSYWNYFSTREYVSPVELLSLPMQISLEYCTAGNKDAFCVRVTLSLARSWKEVVIVVPACWLWFVEPLYLIIFFHAYSTLHDGHNSLAVSTFSIFFNPYFFQSVLFASALYRWEVKEQINSTVQYSDTE